MERVQGRLICTTDLAGDREYLFIPDEFSVIGDRNYEDTTPYFCDGGWGLEDFTNPDIYRSVEVVWITL